MRPLPRGMVHAHVMHSALKGDTSVSTSSHKQSLIDMLVHCHSTVITDSLPKLSQASVLQCLFVNIYLLVTPPSGRLSQATTSSSWSPLHNLSPPAVTGSTNDVAWSLPLRLTNSAMAKDLTSGECKLIRGPPPKSAAQYRISESTVRWTRILDECGPVRKYSTYSGYSVIYDRRDIFTRQYDGEADDPAQAQVCVTLSRLRNTSRESSDRKRRASATSAPTTRVAIPALFFECNTPAVRSTPLLHAPQPQRAPNAQPPPGSCARAGRFVTFSCINVNLSPRMMIVSEWRGCRRLSRQETGKTLKRLLTGRRRRPLSYGLLRRFGDRVSRELAYNRLVATSTGIIDNRQVRNASYAHTVPTAMAHFLTIVSFRSDGLGPWPSTTARCGPGPVTSFDRGATTASGTGGLKFALRDMEREL
ncbi:hypothetical protein EVAR_49641_1 [Eumeta japonica]|uniref:Uncharacterized protein n=1 Tax=Eumeta variegata TaxID=151549 RepID=A0A4C1Y810_EUMVA|nr:hypothetical protein EVAR_49641_1 [Eumeta japonica]